MPKPTSQEVRDHLAHLTLRELSPRTISQRRYVLLDLERFLVGQRSTALLSADSHDLAAWQVHKSATRAGHGMRNCVMHAAGFYRWAVQAGRVVSGPHH